MGVVNRIVHRLRWRRRLASCTLEPPARQVQIRDLGERDFIMAGCPRSGTSLLAAQLHQPPGVVVVMEPWLGLRYPPSKLFSSLRSEIDSGLLRSGRLDLDATDRGELRWTTEDETVFSIEAGDDYLLGVKWPTYWQYLEALQSTRFLVTVRHPAEVVASFLSTGGRLARGLEYDVRFNEPTNSFLQQATSDEKLRRVLLYEHINRQILPHIAQPNVKLVRYERWLTDPDTLLSEIASFLGTRLVPKIEIKPPSIVDHDPETLEMIRTHAPSARHLGYEV